MVKTVWTFNALHLGDNLVHLHFLRKLAQRYPDIQFTHGAPDEHLAQLAPLAWDLPNLTIQSIATIPQGSINAWRGAGGHWYGHPNRNDFAAYHLDWFRHLAGLMGLESPITTAADMLFGYPALDGRADGPSSAAPIDFLIINSPPLSGQWSGYSALAFSSLAWDLRSSGFDVVTTSAVPGVKSTSSPDGGPRLDITAIGRLSQRARCIIGCVTGPMWPCLNIWSAETADLRIHLLDTERVDLAPRTVHCNSLSLVPEILRDHGLL